MYRQEISSERDENRNLVKGETFKTTDEAIQQIRRLSIGAYPKPQSLDFTEYEGFSSPLTCLPPWPNYDDLKPLPVPTLEDTVKKLLGLSKTLCSDDEHAELEQKLKDFCESEESQKLQRNLEARAEMEDNWLSAWWLDVAYLERRAPLPVNVSPFILFPPKLFAPTVEGQVFWTAKLVRGVLEFREKILNRTLPIDKVGITTFDMSQYDWLFGTYRVPGVDKDYLHLGNQNARHIMVTRNGRFFFVPVYEGNGDVLSVGKLAKLLFDIFVMADKPAKNKVGLLTALARDRWGEIHTRLRYESYSNDTAFSAIENSLFILCMNRPADNYAPKLSDWTTYGHELLLETAASGNFGNRWYDKTLQFVVGTNGTAGVVYEHSPIEGIPVCALIDFVVDSVRKAEGEGSPDVVEEYSKDLAAMFPRELRFDLSEPDIQAIGEAMDAMQTLGRNFELGIFTFRGFGKEYLKRKSLSPDSFFQVAIQTAYYRMHGEMTAQYESGTLRKFKLGRTDVIRLPNKETAEFLENLCNSSVSDVQKASLLRSAVNAHKEYASAVCSGQGVDRHLLGLRLIANERKELAPKFDCPAMKKLTQFKLSTSALPSVKDTIMAFGPSEEIGYGVCYNMQKDLVHVQVTAMNTCDRTSAKKLEAFLGETLEMLRGILDSQ